MADFPAISASTQTQPTLCQFLSKTTLPESLVFVSNNGWSPATEERWVRGGDHTTRTPGPRVVPPVRPHPEDLLLGPGQGLSQGGPHSTFRCGGGVQPSQQLASQQPLPKGGGFVKKGSGFGRRGVHHPLLRPEVLPRGDRPQGRAPLHGPQGPAQGPP